jgi:galactokinase
VKGAIEELKKRNQTSTLCLKNMKVAVSGNIPPGSGLSSSSALVCSAFLVTSQLNGVTITIKFYT